MDKYDAAVEYLTNHPDEIKDAWWKSDRHPAGALFRFRTLPILIKEYRSGGIAEVVKHRNEQCLTMLKSRSFTYYGPVLPIIEQIQNDPRIPDSVQITDDTDYLDAEPRMARMPLTDIVASLPLMADYNRRLDAALSMKIKEEPNG